MAESLLQQGPVLNSEETNFMADFTGEELKDLIIHPSDYASIMVENASALLLERYPDFDLSLLVKTEKPEEPEANP